MTIDELVKMVKIALTDADVSACSAGDANQDGYILINEILKAVNNTLNGCTLTTGTPTSTPTGRIR